MEVIANAGVMAIAVLILRWRRASPALRLAIAPVIWVGAAALGVLLIWVGGALLEVPLGRAPEMTMELLLALIAVAFLVGVVRTRLARSAVADLVVKMKEARAAAALRDSLARALHDPSLEVAYRLGDTDRFVDARGHPVDLPDGDESRAVTMIERADRRIAALIHDPALLEDELLVESVCAAAALQIQNERLQAERRAQLDEVEASRARIVEAATTERRRIERDLHEHAHGVRPAGEAPEAVGAVLARGGGLEDLAIGVEQVDADALELDVALGHVAALSSIAEEVAVPAGTALLTEGEPTAALYVVVEGAVEVVGAGGMTAAAPGTAFGTWTLVDQEPSLVAARTTEPSSLLRITRQDFQEHVADHSELALDLLKGLARRLRALNGHEGHQNRYKQSHRGAEVACPVGGPLGRPSYEFTGF